MTVECKNLEKLLKHERVILEMIPKDKREDYIAKYSGVIRLNSCRKNCNKWFSCENYIGYLREGGY